MNVADVGPLPTLPPPLTGERFTLRLPGVPPSKTFGRSMRNARSPQRKSFMALRRAAIQAMAGRKWHEGGVGLSLMYWAPGPPPVPRTMYLDGVMDTLGACQGPTFVYLPIVYIDDCRVVTATVSAHVGTVVEYELGVVFL